MPQLLGMKGITRQFIFMLAFPMVGLLFFSALVVMEKAGFSDRMEQLSHLTQCAVRISSFIHETQKERGATALFLGSGGKRFATPLAAQRTLSDQQTAALLKIKRTLTSEWLPERFRKDLTQGLASLERLPEIRRRVDALTITGEESLAYYTGMHTAFLQAITQLSHLGDHRQAAGMITAYVNFLQGKERAGIERALLSNTFAADRFSPGALRRFTELMAAQKTYFQVFSAFADLTYAAFFRTAMADPVVAEVERMRRLAFVRGSGGEKLELLARLHQALGFGGNIHQFKNYLLRQRREYVEGFDKHHREATDLLARYRELAELTPREFEQLDIIEETFFRYKRNLNVITRMVEAGESIEAIDAVVKIDDDPALTALRILSRETVMGGFDVDAGYWFDTISRKIELLREVETRLSNDLLTLASTLRTEARGDYRRYFTLTAIMLLAAIAIAVAVARAILTQLGGEPALAADIARRITAGDLSPLPAQEKPRSGLIKAMEVMADRLRTHRDELESLVRSRTADLEMSNRKLQEKQKEVESLNADLEARVLREVDKNRSKDMILMHQSRLAAMGEMIGAIAHQWRQPLNALGLLLTNIQDAQAYGELTPPYLKEQTDRGRRVIGTMSATIDDFRHFFRPDKAKETFNLQKALEEALTMVGAGYANRGIEITLNAPPEPVHVTGYRNEYMQVALVLLSNAKDAIRDNKVHPGEVIIDILPPNAPGGWTRLAVRDNGGGIPEAILTRIFDPYFTTKESEGGAGIGLFMAKMIMEEHMEGRIEAANHGKGAAFTLLTPPADPPG